MNLTKEWRAKQRAGLALQTLYLICGCSEGRKGSGESSTLDSYSLTYVMSTLRGHVNFNVVTYMHTHSSIVKLSHRAKQKIKMKP